MDALYVISVSIYKIKYPNSVCKACPFDDSNVYYTKLLTRTHCLQEHRFYIDLAS